MKTNWAGWRELHTKGKYYDTHPNYTDKAKRNNDPDLELIAGFLLRRFWKVAIIGSGYGRETAKIAPFVDTVFAIDVLETRPWMESYLGPKKIFNVKKIDAESWKEEILENSIDFVYSIVTFQHITRDLVKDYIEGFFPRIRKDGKLLIQFSESPTGTFDAEDAPIEPNVKWTRAEIEDLIKKTGYRIYDLQSVSGIGGTRVTRPWIWHWVFFGKDEDISDELNV